MSGIGFLLAPYTGYGIHKNGINNEKPGEGIGQSIKGCTNGESQYSANCLPENVRSLIFPSGYLREYKSLTFRDNGTYSRVTREITISPDPPASDFCSGEEGVVDESTFIQFSEGNWTMKNIATPNNPYGDATEDYLTLRPTSVTPSGGFPNHGGIVHQLDCDVNSLVLWYRDNEGYDNDVYNFYSRYQLAGEGEEEWYPFL